MLPSHARVVIVGGGVIGCSVAYHLTKLGWSDIALVERHKLGCGTTWHSAANFSRLATSASYIRFLGYSREVHQAVEAETGLSVGWRQTGRVQIATTRETLDVYRHIAALGRAVGGVDFEVISPTEVGKKLPLLRTNDLVGGIWSPYDGRVNPTDYVTALARAARNRGATIVEEAPVTAIRIQNGVVAGVVTAAGEIRCEAIVNCAGLWGRHVGRLAGVDVPLYPAEHFYVLTLPFEGVARDMPAFRDPDALIYGREEVGGLLLGCFEAEVKPIAVEALPRDFAFGLLNENWARFEPYMKSAIHRIPALETAPIRMLLNGPESFTADGSIILGESPQLRGFFVAAGMNSGGVVLAAGVGRTMAEWIVEGAPQIDVSAFDIRRFAGHEAEEVWLGDRLREVPSHFYRMRRRPAEFIAGRNHRLSPLHERLVARGAKFGAAMGWERPNWFASPPSLRDETACVREEQHAALDGVAIFDRSSLGKIEISGPDSAAALDRLTLAEIAPLPGRAWLVPFLNARAGVESLPIIVCRSPESWVVLTRAEQVVRDCDWIARHLDPALDVRVRDVTAKFADIVLVGPRVPELLDRFGQGDGSATGLLPGTERALRIGVAQLRVLRCPSTGDWHLLVAPELALGVYDRLVAEGLDLGIRDAGEQAADAIRIGRGLPAWGRDVGPTVSVIEAGLTDGRHVKSAGFVGDETLIRLGRDAPHRRLRAFALSREPRVPLEGGEPIWSDGRCVGFVSSAAFVVAVDRWVVLAGVDVTSGDGAHQIDAAGELVGLENYVPALQMEASA